MNEEIQVEIPASDPEPKGSFDLHKFSNILSVALLLISLLIIIKRLAYVWVFTVDDTYITLRYAANLAAGWGPNFNQGLPHTEGYTSFLWVIVSAIPHVLGFNAVPFVKILGVAATFGQMAIVFLLVSRLASFLTGISRFLPASMAVFMMAGFHPTSIHAVSGMETAFAAFLLILMVYLAVAHTGSRVVYLLPLLGILLGMTRPESNLVIPGILAYCFFVIPRDRRKSFLLSALILYVALGAVYFIWRAGYYDHLFPIPFYLKVSSQELLAGRETAMAFLQMMLIHGGVLGIATLFRPRKEIAFVSILAGAWIAYCMVPASIMDFSWRFCCPSVPLVFTVAAYGLAVWLSLAGPLFQSQSPGKKPLFRLVAVMVVVVWATWSGFSKSAASDLLDKQSYGKALNTAHIRLGKLLNEYEDPNGKPPVIAIGDAGSVPYYSQWRTIDTFGLNDTVIGIQNEHDPQYVFDQNPDLIVVVSGRPDRYDTHWQFPWEGKLFKRCVEQGMTRLAAWRFSHACYLWIMGRPGTDVFQFMEGRLQQMVQQPAGNQPADNQGEARRTLREPGK